ncbi:MAG: hypothetical protein M5U22_01770 [Thermoleophilia bacterium]|nr:hypothetical protein [Thermoleophilia bacterium]
METLIGGSFVASFLAGGAALFAPCCVTVLLPTYLASVFQHKTTVFLMTFVYSLGILLVFLPIGLGVSWLSLLLRQYHTALFIAGGSFLVALGLVCLSGRSMSLPMPLHPRLRGTGVLSVFGLGMFSGIATTCCAPVLAGVLTLSAIPGSLFLGGLNTLSYVLGMVAPLFLLALLLDRRAVQRKILMLRRPLSRNVLGHAISVTLPTLVAGLCFLVLGIAIVYLAVTKQLTLHSSYQIELNIGIFRFTAFVDKSLKVVPYQVSAFVVIALFACIFHRGYGELRRLLIGRGWNEKR